MELARHLEAETAPVEALRHWLRAGVEFMATKKGMAAALAMAAQGSPDLVAYSLDRLTRAVGELLRRAAAAGEIRVDIGPEDLLRTLVGMCYAHDRPGWQAKVLRLVDVFIDGLRRRARRERPSRGPRRHSIPAALMFAVHQLSRTRWALPMTAVGHTSAFVEGRSSDG